MKILTSSDIMCHTHIYIHTDRRAAYTLSLQLQTARSSNDPHEEIGYTQLILQR